VAEAEELRTMVGPNAGAATSDIDLGLPLGCLYEAASSLKGLEMAAAPAAAPMLPVTARSVSVVPQYSDNNFTEYAVSLVGLVLGDQQMNNVSFSVYADYDGIGKTPGNLALLRLVFNRAILRDEASRSADYSGCGDLAVQAEGTRQNLRLHYGREHTLNTCIFEKMGDTDRALMNSIHANFLQLLEGAKGDHSAMLRELLSVME